MQGKPIDVLLVEDNPDHAELTMKALKQNNVLNEVHWAKDGREALDFMYHLGKYADEKTSPRPGLILLDIRLPKVDGLEVLKQLKDDPQFKSIPIIMLTTSDRDEEIAKSYAGGANSYVVKPMDFEDFMKKVKELNLYWTLTNNLPGEW
ncbi:MAG: response regulator [Deltaproteobacteria bacterium]|nr:response regulator [Deltaproteobacteria bacterium]